MKPAIRGRAAFFVGFMLVIGSCRWCGADDSEVPPRLTLADLATYRAALAGKVTADDASAADPPAPSSFKDLWSRPDAFRGRRVTVEGRIERIFRQSHYFYGGVAAAR